jgi:hypothetical protein
LKRLELGDYGSKYMRLGDLNGDGMLEMLFVQVAVTANENQPIVTCLTAVDLEGKILWQIGKPDPRNLYFGSDFAVQIHDLDRDGKNEVICILGEAEDPGRNVLKILEGSTGRTLREVKLPSSYYGGRDSLLFADFSGNGYPQDTVIKDRYTTFWVYDKNFRELWSHPFAWKAFDGADGVSGTGHYPAVYDLNGDGRDELLCGYTLFSHDGKTLWEIKPEEWEPQLLGHNDAVYIDDLDGDGKTEIGLAVSAGDPGDQMVLLDSQGNILFKKRAGHCQHVIMGKFRPDLPGKQVCFLDRAPAGSDLRALTSLAVAGHSGLFLFSKVGEPLLSHFDEHWCTAMVTLENWTGRHDENFIGLYSRGYAPAGLLDGRGQEIATFPIPEAIKTPGGGPQGKDLYDDYYLQHINCWGDDREEVFVYNHRVVYVYTNGAPPEAGKLEEGWLRNLHRQIPRLYNNNFYPGRL